METKTVYRILMSGIIFASFLLAYLYLVIIFPYKTFKANKQPFTVLTKKVLPGENFKYEADICFLSDKQSEIFRYFRSVGDVSLIYAASPTSGIYEPNKCDKYIISLMVPRDMVPGTYYVGISVQTKINSFRTIIETARTENFTVLEKDGTESSKTFRQILYPESQKTATGNGTNVQNINQIIDTDQEYTPIPVSTPTPEPIPDKKPTPILTQVIPTIIRSIPIINSILK